MVNKDKIFTGFFYLSIIAILLLFALQKIHDTDVWLHLGIGKYIVEHGALPDGDVFTYTSYGKPYEYFEWLFQASLYLLYQYTGYDGLMVFKLILWLLTMGFLWQRMKTEGVESRWAAVFAFFPAFWLADRWRDRPENVGYFFLALYLWIWSQYRRRGRNYLYFLPWLQILWINLHPSALMGILVYLIILTGEGIDYLRDKNKGNMRVVKALALMVPILAAASFVNPYGYKMLIIPFLYSSNLTYKQVIMEWLPIWKFGAFYYVYLAFLVPAALSFIPRLVRARENLRILDLLLFIFGGVLPFVSARYVGIFAVIALPLAAGNFYGLYLHWAIARGFREPRRQKVPAFRWAWPIMILLLGCGFIFYLFPKRGLLGWGSEKLLVPQKAVAFLQSNALPGPIFNEYTWGGYLILEAYPRYLAYIDSRCFDLEVLKEYKIVEEARSGWQHILKRRGVNVILVKSLYLDSGFLVPLVPQLIQSSDWLLIGSEDAALVFLRNIPENLFWAQKFSLPKTKAFEEIIVEGKFLIDNFKITQNTYSSVGWAYWMLGNYKEAKLAYQEQLKINPHHQGARRNLELLTQLGY